MALACKPTERRYRPLETPGKHRLELAPAPIARPAANAVMLDMAIPPAATSTVVVPESGAAAGQVVSHSANSVVADGMRHFSIPGGKQLSIRWPIAEATAAAAGQQEAAQLLWWKYVQDR